MFYSISPWRNIFTVKKLKATRSAQILATQLTIELTIVLMVVNCDTPLSKPTLKTAKCYGRQLTLFLQKSFRKKPTSWPMS